MNEAWTSGRGSPRLRALSAVLFVIIAALALVVFLRGRDSRPPAPLVEGVTLVEPPVPMGEFRLTDHRGELADLADLRGKPSLVYFGYTHCPDFCPATMEMFKRVREGLGEAADSLRYVFVTTDPDRDTPEQIRAYFLARGVQDFALGLTGPEPAIRAAGAPLGVYFADNPSVVPDGHASHTVDHNTQTYLLDSDARLRAIFAFGVLPDAILARVREWL